MINEDQTYWNVLRACTHGLDAPDPPENEGEFPIDDTPTSVYIARPGNHLFEQREKFSHGPEDMFRYAREDDNGETERTRSAAELAMLRLCVGNIRAAGPSIFPFANLPAALSVLGTLQMLQPQLRVCARTVQAW